MNTIPPGAKLLAAHRRTATVLGLDDTEPAVLTAVAIRGEVLCNRVLAPAWSTLTTEEEAEVLTTWAAVVRR